MGSITTSTPTGPVFLSDGREGADATIRIENNSNRVIKKEQIVFKLSSPDGIDVQIGNATKIGQNKWRSVKDLDSARRLSMPIFISPSRGRNDSTNSINISVELEDKTVKESTLKLCL